MIQNLLRNRKTKQASIIALQIFLMAAWLFIGWEAREIALQTNQEMILVEQARQYILNYEDYTRQPISSAQLTQSAIRGMVADTHDPRAVYFDASIASRVQEDRTGLYAGIGMSGDVQDSGLLITDVNLGEPAAEYGLLGGDMVIAIDGYRLRDNMRYEEISALIRGQEGTLVTLTILRDGEELTFEIPRKSPQTVTYKMLPDNIGYISLDLFTENASEEMYNGLTTLLANEPTGLIWDLRGNGGGSLTETVQILDYFIDGGPVMYVESEATSQTITYTVEAGGIATEIPLAVLIDKYSYSAPETTVAAISQRGRGVLIGETTYGKGTINMSFPLQDGSVLRLTVARWLSPNKEWFEGRGVPPDIFVTDDPATIADEALVAATNYLQTTSITKQEVR